MPGSATVVAARIFTLAQTSFRFSNDGTSAIAGFSMPEITAEAARSGNVAAYLSLGEYWRALPDVFQFEDGAVVVTTYAYGEGFVSVRIRSPTAAAVIAAVRVFDGDLVKVVVVAD